jgi:hypothetical protein
VVEEDSPPETPSKSATADASHAPDAHHAPQPIVLKSGPSADQGQAAGDLPPKASTSTSRPHTDNVPDVGQRSVTPVLAPPRIHTQKPKSNSGNQPTSEAVRRPDSMNQNPTAPLSNQSNEGNETAQSRSVTPPAIEKPQLPAMTNEPSLPVPTSSGGNNLNGSKSSGAAPRAQPHTMTKEPAQNISPPNPPYDPTKNSLALLNRVANGAESSMSSEVNPSKQAQQRTEDPHSAAAAGGVQDASSPTSPGNDSSRNRSSSPPSDAPSMYLLVVVLCAQSCFCVAMAVCA